MPAAVADLLKWLQHTAKGLVKVVILNQAKADGVP
jgi:hypothetical protein